MSVTVALQLLQARGRVQDALKELGIIRTGNVLADVTEYIVVETLGLELSGVVSAGFDASDPATGETYQIKGRRHSGRRGVELGVVRKPDFDCLVAVIYGPDWTIERVYKMSSAAFQRLSKAKPYVGESARTIRLTQRLLAEPEIEDITYLFREEDQ